MVDLAAIPLLHGASAVVAALLAFEPSLVYGLVATALLRRAGLGRWSLAPFAFLLLTAVELACKLLVVQPSVPAELQRPAPSPFVTVALSGSFPSGHAIRSGFLAGFAAVLCRTLWREKRHLLGTVLPAVLIVLGALLALTRIVLGYHWLSDVVAGYLLGLALALIIAPPVARQLLTRARASSRHM